MNKPDYKNSITNLSNSILKHFGATPFHNTIPEVDKYLEGKKRVIVFLFDGMGRYIIEKHLPADSFLRKNIIHYMTSTFPPTTVAATTSFSSAKFPIETGWLAWTQYFKEVDSNINVFTNKDDVTGEKIGGPHLGRTHMPYEHITSIINKARGKEIATFTQGTGVDNTHFWNRHLKPFIKHNYKLSHEIGDESFIYAYWAEPDHMMHGEGTTNKKVHRIILKINKYLEKFSKKNPDVTTLVIADHGHIDITNINLWNDKDFNECLVRPMTFEKRSANFFVKPEKKEEFVKMFNEKFGDHYELYTREQIFDMKLYGDAEPSDNVKRFFGDYIAISIDGYTFKDQEKSFSHKAHHAGGTLDEMIISVIGIN